MLLKDSDHASMYRDLERISRVSWSTSPVGLNANATSGPRPYNWLQVLSKAPAESTRLFIGKLNAASNFGLPTDSLTILDYSALMLGGRGNPHTPKRIMAFAASIRMEHFVFLANLGHASSEFGQEDLLLDVIENIGVVESTSAVDSLNQIRNQLGEHAGDTDIAPHYVADVVSLMGVKRTLSTFRGA